MSYVELEEVKFNDFAKVDYVANSAKTIISDGTKVKTVTYDSLGYKSSGINVTVSCDNATSVSISDGTTTRTKSGSSASFEVQYGTYTVSATNGTKTASEQLVVDTAMDYTVTLSFVHIYGIRRDQNSSSPEWTRTDEAVGKTVVASVGNVTIGHSDFDDCYPWSEMKRYVMSTGDVMVYIPEFWYKRVVDENGIETIQIADNEVEGFSIHPGSGKYIGAYGTSGSGESQYWSKPNAGVKSYARLPYDRQYIRQYKRDGWQPWSISISSAIEMLYLVEFATNNSQAAIGLGYVNGSRFTNTGECDGMTYLTGRSVGTDGLTHAIYRGIEDPWGLNILIDGVNINQNTSTIYVCTNPENFVCDTNTNYIEVSYKLGNGTSSGGSYITKMGYDPDLPWVMFPVGFGGSDTTGYCDMQGLSVDGEWSVLAATGVYSSGTAGGIFNKWGYGSNRIQYEIGAPRLVYYPSLDTNNSTTVTGEWTYGG